MAACSGDDGGGPAGPGGASVSAAPPSSGGAAGAGGLGHPGDDAAADQVVVTGLAAPWGVAFLPSGTVLIAERDTGRILWMPAGGGTPQEVLTLPRVRHRDESGLLGLAVSPTYADDHLVYAYYSSETDNRIVRFTLADGDDDKGTRPTVGEIEPILTGLGAAPVHDGGRIAFGPDGMLYAGVGDASRPPAAQDLNSLNGKILRMRPDGSAPDDNPFPGSLVYSLGHRNVQGLAWDSAGRLWATEFGQNTWDEINLIEPGANYGWPVVEGVGDTQNGRFTNPLVVWTPAEASPSGAAIRDNTLYVAALRGQRIWAVDIDPAAPAERAVVGEPRQLRRGDYGRLRTLLNAPDGTLWLVTSNTDGRLRGQPHQDDDRIISLR
ncbi:MAG: PQQ-dependent sugar dehydrogenase [Frankia sp.]|nr:PQQ-dependent sugar dehydrogenase [Frankia sp.]